MFFVISVFKLNLNNDMSFGMNCFDYMGTRNTNISSDYLAILGAYFCYDTNCNFPIESAHFCGIYDGINQIYPGLFSKYCIGAYF